MLVVWGACLGAAYRGIFGGRRTFVVIAGLVVSHWGLDWLTHAPDMALSPDGPRVGPGLWHSVNGALVLEVPMFVAGVALYVGGTRASDGVGRWALVSLCAALLCASAATAASGGAVVPWVTTPGAAGLAPGLLIPVWAWGADHHRTMREIGRAHV